MSAQLHSQDEQHLRQLEMSWDDAVARRDADSLAHLITDDYEVTDQNGHTHDKATILKAVASADPQLKPYRRDNVSVRIDGHTAVITGRITWANGNGHANGNGKSNGNGHANGNGKSNGNGNGNGNGHSHSQAEYLKLYVKRDDGWKALVARATRINER